MTMHIHKWKGVWKVGEPRLVGFLGFVGTTKFHYTGIERCKKCGKRQKDQGGARLYSYCSVAAAAGGALIVNFFYSGLAFGAASLVAGLLLLIGATLAAIMVSCIG